MSGWKRASVAREMKSAPHTIRFVDADRRLTRTMHWENGRCLWAKTGGEYSGTRPVEPLD